MYSTGMFGVQHEPDTKASSIFWDLMWVSVRFIWVTITYNDLLSCRMTNTGRSISLKNSTTQWSLWLQLSVVSRWRLFRQSQTTVICCRLMPSFLSLPQIRSATNPQKFFCSSALANFPLLTLTPLVFRVSCRSLTLANARPKLTGFPPALNLRFDLIGIKRDKLLLRAFIVLAYPACSHGCFCRLACQCLSLTKKFSALAIPIVERWLKSRRWLLQQSC